MERAREIGNHALWLIGHLAFTIVINLTCLGGYFAYTQYQTTQPIQIDVSQLTAEDRAELSKEIFLAGQDEQDQQRGSRKKG